MGTVRRITIAFVIAFLLCQVGWAGVKAKKFTTGSGYLFLEILDDRMIHCEVSAIGGGPSANELLNASPMVFRKDFSGPSVFIDNGNTMETRDMRIEVNNANLCVAIKDKTKSNAYLTTICPDKISDPLKYLNIDPGLIQNVYGLGQRFVREGSSDGDWITLGAREGGPFGNDFSGFQNAAVGNVQIPVMYALGDNNLNYALFLDNVYKQKWDFSAYWWKVSMYGDQLRYYVIAGPDLFSLRASYMKLTGTAPVPPRKAFGLWVSEFGYRNFDEIDALLTGLRSEHFPVDGFVLDLNWFGGVKPNDGQKSRMGRLNWDESNTDGNNYYFPNPDSKIQQYALDNISLAAIEESYISDSPHVDTFNEVPKNLLAFQRTAGKCDGQNRANPVVLTKEDFWGHGYMFDWSNSETGKWVNDNRRFPNLIFKGINTHWTDLGEPETFDDAACYKGVETTASRVKNEHGDIHNLYNLLWNESIWSGYFEKQGKPNNLGVINPRPFILTRSGTAGTQRFGTAMWSGDIAANLRSLATHMNAQMHMSFSGIDYYSSDSGGFRREVLPHNDKSGVYRGYDNENYTQWFANSAWFDVPVRPHTDNEFNSVNPRYATSPHLIGRKESNLANIRQRYELAPYYYSLAYRAYLYGEPVVAPPVFYYQNDKALRSAGHEKLIGKDILVGIVAAYGEYERNVYLPAGKWVNYHTDEWVSSTGASFINIPVYRGGIFRLPAFVRAGAIIPQMAVDDSTKDIFGNRKAGATERNELIVRVYADPQASSFTLYEDDGKSLDYDSQARPVYHYRTTAISQRQTGSTVTVAISRAVDVDAAAASGSLVKSRQNVVKLVVENRRATAVKLNGSPLSQTGSRSAFDAAASGWFNAGTNLILAKSGPEDVYAAEKVFVFSLQPTVLTASVNFVCDKGETQPGESIYVVGTLSAMGGPGWDVLKAVKLDPNIYWEYIVNPPPGGNNGLGPSAPVWTGVVSGIPTNTNFEWKCIRRREDGSGDVQWQPGANNTFTTSSSGGYSGRAYGSF